MKNIIDTWEYKYFNPREISCKGKTCGCMGELWNSERYGEKMPSYLKVALYKINKLRELWGKPIILNSAHRCRKHNMEVGGAINSMHLRIAFDCRMPKEEQQEFIELAQKIGFTGIGVYENFVHLDLGKKRKWKGKY